MTRLISIHSGKGGVGKTTFSANVGAALASRGKKVLLVDTDIFTRGLTFLLNSTHANAAVGFSFLDFAQVRSKGEIEPNERIEKLDLSKFIEVSANLWLLPATRRPNRSMISEEENGDDKLFDLNQHFDREMSRRAFSYFDFVLIDCRAGADLAAIAPTTMADDYVVITEEDNTSIRATNLILESIENLQERVGSSIMKVSIEGRKGDSIGSPDSNEFQLSNDTNLGGTYSDKEYIQDEVQDGQDRTARFLGFVISMSILPRPAYLAQSLERIFSGNCLGVIPLSERARRAFIEDKLVVQKFPNDVASVHFRFIASNILSEKPKSAIRFIQKKWSLALFNSLFLLTAALALPYLAIAAITDLFVVEGTTTTWSILGEIAQYGDFGIVSIGLVILFYFLLILLLIRRFVR